MPGPFAPGAETRTGADVGTLSMPEKPVLALICLLTPRLTDWTEATPVIVGGPDSIGGRRASCEQARSVSRSLVS